MQENLFNIRQNYDKASLDFETIGHNPYVIFRDWLQNAMNSNINEPTAMSLSTAQSNGRCSSRIVLLKCFDEAGFCFFTNYGSTKARQIAQNSWGALLFFWPELEQQIRLEGLIEKCETALSDEYFNQRPIESRISAVISPQSETVPSRGYLEQRWACFKDSGVEIKRPEYWGGYRLVPLMFEFWQGRPNRLHDRVVFDKNNAEGWDKRIVAP